MQALYARGEENVEIAHRSEFTGQPFEILLDGFRLFAAEQVREDPNGSSQTAYADPHLMHAVGQASQHGGLVGGDVMQNGTADRLEGRGQRFLARQDGFGGRHC